MRQVANALEAYRDHYGTLPPAFSTDEQGNTLHCWRVLILPFVDDPDTLSLYKQIRLEEPWDSEWNAQFHDHVPPFFTCPVSKSHENPRAEWKYHYSHYYLQIDDSGKIVPDSGILFAERRVGNIWMDPRHEIRLIDTKTGVNLNQDGITSWHNYTNPWTGSRERGAHICTFDFEVKWVPEKK
jgi:hypothetical protein